MSDGFANDRSAGHRSLMPAVWRPYDICREISALSQQIGDIARQLEGHKPKGDEWKTHIRRLTDLSHTADELANTVHEQIMQIVCASVATISNPEILGNGPLLQFPSVMRSQYPAAAPQQQPQQPQQSSSAQEGGDDEIRELADIMK